MSLKNHYATDRERTQHQVVDALSRPKSEGLGDDERALRRFLESFVLKGLFHDQRLSHGA
jgi:hypothetical protein